MGLLTNLIRAIPPSFPVGYCPPTPQQLANDLMGGTQFVLLINQGSFIYNYGSVTPAPENRVFPWLYSVEGRWYTFQFGMWVSPNPRPPNGEWIIWPDDETSLWSYDGGDGTNPTTSPPTATSGAMWQLVTAMKGRFPLGAGDVPGTDPVQSNAVGATGGAGEHTLTEAELPEVTVTIRVKNALGTDLDPATDRFLAHPNAPGGLTNADLTDTFGSGDSHSIMPPFVAVNYGVRTARRFYTLAA